jgi:predicted NBD/HSP70 family sugar kinase
MPAVPSSLRAANQAQVLETLLELGAASRAELAKVTGMSQPTAGKIADELLSAEIVEEIPAEVTGSVGRPGKQLRLARQRARFVLIELGVERTRLAAAPVAPSDSERWDVEFATPTSEARWLDALRAEQRGLGVEAPWGVLLTVPGMLDERNSNILLCPNLHWAEGSALAPRVGEVFAATPLLLQEIQALALGELQRERSRPDFLLVDVGDGVGGAVLIGGRPFRGPLPLHGELGHTPIPGSKRACGCGGVGCLETLIAAPGLLQSFRAHARRPGATTGELVASLTRGELPGFLTEALDALVMCVVAAMNLYGLPRVVLTGLIGELGPGVQEHVQSSIARSALWSRFGSVSVEFAPRQRARGLGLAAFQRLVLQGAAPAVEAGGVALQTKGS